ncbi:hypothetical protein DYST_00512 [Dyella terrae]|nr:hypothetical protein DYST_00512 [Dyella terrae]
MDSYTRALSCTGKQRSFDELTTGDAAQMFARGYSASLILASLSGHSFDGRKRVTPFVTKM